MKLFKQHKVGKSWGHLMQVAGQIGYVITVVNLCLLIITTSTLLQTRGIMMPVWLLGLLAVIVIGSAGLIIFKYGLPSFFGAWNQQFYKHNNPMRADLEKIQKQLDEMARKIDELCKEQKIS